MVTMYCTCMRLFFLKKEQRRLRRLMVCHVVDDPQRASYKYCSLFVRVSGRAKSKEQRGKQHFPCFRRASWRCSCCKSDPPPPLFHVNGHFSNPTIEPTPATPCPRRHILLVDDLNRSCWLDTRRVMNRFFRLGASAF